MKTKTTFRSLLRWWPSANPGSPQREHISYRRPVLLTQVGALLFILLSLTYFFPDNSDAKPRRSNRPGRVIYVKPDGTGNGKSWDKAFGNLHEALATAKKNDRIWVAKGAYLPTYDGNRNISFKLVEAVALLGGFAGTETHEAERDPEKNPTILSGEIGTPDSTDNSFTIVLGRDLTSATLVDGFIIRGGRADSTVAEVHLSTCGAAWFNHNASPTIRNCRFEKNTAREGGAIYNYAGKSGTASPVIIDCTFAGNHADLDGGCIYNNGDQGKSKTRIENTLFEDNLATYGAGIMNRARYGMTLVEVMECRFIKNRALVKGSVIFNHRDRTGICQAMSRIVFLKAIIPPLAGILTVRLIVMPTRPEISK